MVKKIVSYILIFIFLLSFYLDSVFAYDYVKSENEIPVEEKINEIYERKHFYEQLSGNVENDEEGTVEVVSSDYYWWPMGSSDTNEVDGKTFASGEPETVLITSPFGYRSDPFGSGATVYHSGLDISGGSGLGSVNIIASKDGVVVFSSKGGEVCPSGSQQSLCGGGYGNYIIIQHTDGNYTLYAHLYENSITVGEGEAVKQGQVIAKMGSSGNSTGAHLHFEVREGQNAYSAAVDPLNYVSPDDPRPANASNDLVEYIERFEGHTTIVGDSYLVEDIGDGVRSVGKGVVLEYNESRFKAHGIDIKDYPLGSKIKIDIADAIKNEIISDMKSYVEGVLSKNSIQLKEYQINSLVSFTYNCGTIEGDFDFPGAYKKYGDTEKLYDNFFGLCIHVNGEVWAGLVSRRKSEWHLFHTGEYIDG